MELVFLVWDIFWQWYVECLVQYCEQDNEVEVEWEIVCWWYCSGVVIQCCYEFEIVQQDSVFCLECWIDWQVIDVVGQEINLMCKQFYNFCQ